jgi:hypothetical protein
MQSENLRSMMLAIALCVSGYALQPGAIVAADDPPAGPLTTQDETKLLNGLKVYNPVFVHGPYPHLLYTANSGDLVEFQISYPISPPFPTGVSVTFDPAHFRFVDILNTGGEVVVLKPGQPQQGLIGVGYFSVFLKAVGEGNTQVDVKVTFDDGTSAVVPFHVRINPARRTARQIP